MKNYFWLILSVLLMALGVGMYLIAPYTGNLPFMIAGASVLAALLHFRKNWMALTVMLTVVALILRLALRGYGWWGYTLLFIAALLVLYHIAPPVLWKIIVAFTCLGLLYFCIVEVPIIRNARTDREPERPYLIVLGAAVHGKEPSLTLVRRLEGALDYLNSYPDSVAIVSGGMGKGESVTEGQAMFDWLTGRGIAPERILIENRATSTRENLQFSFDIIRERGDEPAGNVAIVSSAYHLYRAKCMAEKLGVPDAAGVAAPWGYFLVMLNYFIREAFGVTHLWVFGD